jgi:hypothetical protein
MTIEGLGGKKVFPTGLWFDLAMGQAKHWILDNLPDLIAAIRSHRTVCGDMSTGLPAPGCAKGSVSVSV